MRPFAYSKPTVPPTVTDNYVRFDRQHSAFGHKPKLQYQTRQQKIHFQNTHFSTIANRKVQNNTNISVMVLTNTSCDGKLLNINRFS